jgi:hypothetical protein
MSEILYKEESYRIIGICMDVHNNLGNSTLTDLDNSERGITYATNAQMKNERKDNKEREIVTKLTACSQPTNNFIRAPACQSGRFVAIYKFLF